MAETLVRAAARRDWPTLLDLYNHYVVKTQVTFDTEPFTLETRRPWFEQFSEAGPHRVLVAEREGRVVGYAASQPFRRKAAYRTSVETSIYLAPEQTGTGIGQALYAALFESLRHEEAHRAYAGIALPNPASIALHRRFRFRSVGVYREVGHKLGRYWDVEWFEKELGE